MNTYAVDLSLMPTTFDQLHVYLAGTVVLLMLILIVVLLSVIIGHARCKRKAAIKQGEPEVKIVEVEKLVPAPAPEPVVLKEATPDAALQLLALMQNEARFIDFIQEDITAFSDADVGAAARVVHQGCRKVINEHFTFAAVYNDQEGNKVTLPEGFDASSVRLTGNIVGKAPFTGTLIHKGWKVTDIRLPKLTSGHNTAIVAPAEVEL